MNTPIYKESQHFRQAWLWVLLTAINLLFIYGVVQQVIFGIPFGTKPAPDIGLIITALLILGGSIFLGSMRLDTEIREDGLYYRFYPLHLRFRKVEWADIRDAFVRTYKPIQEYGGWGIRIGLFGYGKALNVRGNQGLQLVFKNNKKLLLGTQHPQEIEKALERVGVELHH